MITVEQARASILKNIKSTKTIERVDIFSSLGRILAKDIRSNINIPAFDNSAMDGYAVRSADVKGASSASPAI